MSEAMINIADNIIRKTKVSYSINEKLERDFDLICKGKKYKKSEIVENLMRVFVEQERSLLKI